MQLCDKSPLNTRKIRKNKAVRLKMFVKIPYIAGRKNLV